MDVKKKLKGRCDGGGVEDRLSSLPDHLIHHILSFMPTKYVVAASVLSTRWYYLWTSTSNIEIFDQHLNSTGTKKSDLMVKIRFMNFVDKVLSLHHAKTLTKFTLSCTEFYDDTWVNAWISIALRCNVQELFIDVRLEHLPVVFPRHILNWESLTKLTIDIDDKFYLKVSNSICFPNLKYLDLAHVWFCGDHLTQQVFISFPVLEVFLALELGLLKITTVEISAPLLKSLRLDYDRLLDEIQGHGKIIIHAHSLVLLNFSEPTRFEYSIYDTPSILDATIDVLSTSCLIQLLRGICNVKQLTLDGSTTEVLLTFDTFHLPTFPSLVDLTVDLPDNSLDVGHLINLLHKMPKIEYLVFNAPYSCEDHEISMPPGIIPESLPACLKSVTFHCFGACEFELYWVKFFLQNARSLEKIILISSEKISRDPKKQVEVQKQLLMIPKASPQCIIDFS